MVRKLALFLGKTVFSLKRKKPIGIPKKILIIRMGAIGDVLMTTPVLRSIRSRFPKSKISYLVGNHSKAVISNNPNIDNIIDFDDNIVFKGRLIPVLRLIKMLRKEKFDLCITLERDFRWNLLSFFSKIPTRVGFDREGEGFPNNYNIKYNGEKYELDYNLEVAKVIRAIVTDRKMQLSLSNEDKQFATSFFKKHKLIGKKVVGVIPGGASNPGAVMGCKRWPLENYINLIDKLVKKYDVIMFGGPDDKDFAQEIKDKIKSSKLHDAIGICTISQSAALIDKCKVVVTHDSGPLHISAAMSPKIVALFGPTDPKRFAPPEAIVLSSSRGCVPCYSLYGEISEKCHFECMGDIRASKVYNSVVKELSNTHNNKL